MGTKPILNMHSMWQRMHRDAMPCMCTGTDNTLGFREQRASKRSARDNHTFTHIHPPKHLQWHTHYHTHAQCDAHKRTYTQSAFTCACT